MSTRNILTIIVLAFISSGLFAQEETERRFNATLVAGMNISQIDGDQTAGYHKIGLNIGARAGIVLHPNWETGFEILFSQQGAQEPFVKGYTRNFKCHLNYISVPFLIHFKDWKVVNEKKQIYHRFHFGVGAAYNRLMGGYIDDPYGRIYVADITASPFLKNHVTLLADIGFFFTRNWGINLRYERAPMNIRQQMLYNPHMIVFRAMFTF